MGIKKQKNRSHPPRSLIDSLFTACETGDFNFVKSELSTTTSDATAYRNDALQDLLHVAIVSKQLDVCKYLMDHGFNLYGRMQSSLVAAVNFGDVATTEYIASCIPSEQSAVLREAFRYACSKGFAEVVVMLLATYSNFDLEASLYDACLEGQIPVIRDLLDAGADSNAVLPRERRDFRLPLHAAISRGHQNAVDFLLQSGADFLTGADERGLDGFNATVYESLLRSLGEGQRLHDARGLARTDRPPGPSPLATAMLAGAVIEDVLVRGPRMQAAQA
jgi:ankyrin repeat protein